MPASACRKEGHALGSGAQHQRGDSGITQAAPFGLQRLGGWHAQRKAPKPYLRIVKQPG
jgi:hypothetical protein